MQNQSVRPCPCCGGHVAELLQEMNFSRETDSPLPECYRVSACSDCGFVFDDVDAGRDAFRRYYRLSAKYAMYGIAGSGDLSAVDRARYGATLEFLLPHLRKDMSIADIGCGKGGLMRLLCEYGFRKLCGVEASEQCVEMIRASGMEAVHAALEEFDPERKFDLVIVAHIFEHLWDPASAAARLAGLLSPEGLVYVEVPDASRYSAFGHGVYYYFDLEHINHFDPETMECIWKRAGFQVAATRQAVLEPVPGFTIPVLRMLFSRTGEVPAFRRSETCKARVEEYIRAMREKETRLDRIEIPPGGPVFLWGGGAYAKWLEGAGKIRRFRPLGMIDRNPGLRGKWIGQLPVLPPEAIETYNREDSAILITSVLYAAEIRNQLRQGGWRGAVVDFF